MEMRGKIILIGLDYAEIAAMEVGEFDNGTIYSEKLQGCQVRCCKFRSYNWKTSTTGLLILTD